MGVIDIILNMTYLKYFFNLISNWLLFYWLIFVKYFSKTFLREETEKLRRENAEGFFSLRHLIGSKGEKILENIYFCDFPHLAELEEAPPKNQIESIEDLTLDQQINQKSINMEDDAFKNTVLDYW